MRDINRKLGVTIVLITHELEVVKAICDSAVSLADVGLAAGESISDLLLQLKEKALAATDKSLSTASRKALNEDFKALRDQIASVTSNAEFNGVNLLSASATGFQALANASGSASISVAAASSSVTAAW